MVKNPPAMQETQETGFSPWAGKIPWRRKWQSTPVFLPGESHGQRSLGGYSPWGHKELVTATHMHTCSTEPAPQNWKKGQKEQAESSASAPPSQPHIHSGITGHGCHSPRLTSTPGSVGWELWVAGMPRPAWLLCQHQPWSWHPEIYWLGSSK